MSVTKDQLLSLITRSLSHENKPVECSFEQLRFTFGFKRISTKVALLGVLFGKSEEDLSYAPKKEIIQTVLDWAEENGFACYYNGGSNPLRDTFTFYKFIPKQTQ